MEGAEHWGWGLEDVLTAQESPELMEQAFKLGANSYHVKPPDFAGWVELVRTLYNVWSMAKRPKL